MNPKPMTDRVRTVMVALFAITVLVVLAGWLFGRDPTMLTFLVGFEVAGIGAGEASNIGKRATAKPEVIEAMRQG